MKSAMMLIIIFLLFVSIAHGQTPEDTSQEICEKEIALWISHENYFNQPYNYVPIKFYRVECINNVVSSYCKIRCLLRFMKEENGEWKKIRNKILTFYFKNGKIYKFVE